MCDCAGPPGAAGAQSPRRYPAGVKRNLLYDNQLRPREDAGVGSLRRVGAPEGGGKSANILALTRRVN